MPKADDTRVTPWNDMDWRARQANVVELMRSISEIPDPQQMVARYGAWIREVRPVETSIAVSRRDLEPPFYRITRSTKWSDEINPWRDKHKLPLIEGGLIADLLYSNEPYFDNDFHPDPADPAFEFLKGFRSIRTTPIYDDGQALNMNVSLDSRPNAFDAELIPEQIWTTNLFGRATSNLVLKQRLDEAYKRINEELRVVGGIQRSLLPETIPDIPSLDLGVYYEPSAQAGGDGWDLFNLPCGRVGLFVYDVAGHGTPAAVIMAIVHSLSHTCTDPRWTQNADPGALLEHINEHLANRYTSRHSSFVTAYLGVFNPADLSIRSANAGHPPPRVKRCADGSVFSIDGVGGIPLGIMPDIAYESEAVTLEQGDQLVLFTDGITEAFSPTGELFGMDRLDRAIEDCTIDAGALVGSLVDAVKDHTADLEPTDDRTLLVGKVGANQPTRPNAKANASHPQTNPNTPSLEGPGPTTPWLVS
ncbi:MAG: PP2C family protein-serine/threonine phosphatase [Planctomycetota bacterium]